MATRSLLNKRLEEYEELMKRTFAVLMMWGTGAGFAWTDTLNRYTQTNLTSDLPGVAAQHDPHLINAWGAVGDALGHPLRLILTGGQAADCKQALALREGWNADAVWADKGYDAHYIIDAVSGRNALVVIPPKANRKIQ